MSHAHVNEKTTLIAATLRHHARRNRGKTAIPEPPFQTRGTERDQLISGRVCVCVNSRARAHLQTTYHMAGEYNVSMGKKRREMRGKTREAGICGHRVVVDVVSLTFSRTLPRFLASFRSASEPEESCANGGCSAFLKPKTKTRMAQISTIPTGIAYAYCECCSSRLT